MNDESTPNTDPLGDDVEGHVSETPGDPSLEAQDAEALDPGEEEGPEAQEPEEDPWEEWDEEDRRKAWAEADERASRLRGEKDQVTIALRQERARAREAEQRMQYMIEQIQAAQQQQQPEQDLEDEIPDREEDVVGHLKGSILKELREELDRRDLTQAQKEQIMEQARQQEAQRAQIHQAMAQAEESADAAWTELEEQGEPISEATTFMAKRMMNAKLAAVQMEAPHLTEAEQHQIAAEQVEAARQQLLANYAGNEQQLARQVLQWAEANGWQRPEQQGGALERQRQAVQGATRTGGRPASQQRSKVHDARTAINMPEEEYEAWIEGLMKKTGKSMPEVIEMTSKELAYSD